jgi:hypothetical protein
MENDYDSFKSLIKEIDKVKLAAQYKDSPEYGEWNKRLLWVSKKLFGEESNTYKEIKHFWVGARYDQYQSTMEKLKDLLQTIISKYETPGEYFVAHEYVQDQTDDLRESIEDVLRDSRLKPYYADAEVKEGHILLNKILPKITSTKFGIYEISNPKKPNVFLELGMAIALGKQYYIIVRKGTEIPSDLQGLDRIEYGSMKELKEELKKKVKL